MSTLIANFVAWIEQAAIFVINQFIISIGDLINTILSLLPDMPTFPLSSIPSQVAQWWAYGSYWFPFTFFFALCATLTTIWIVWLVASIPLRWAKAIRGDE